MDRTPLVGGSFAGLSSGIAEGEPAERGELEVVEGEDDGIRDDSALEGEDDSALEGLAEGTWEGEADGKVDGCWEGSGVGISDGASEGIQDGKADGSIVEGVNGKADGSIVEGLGVGPAVGNLDMKEGAPEGGGDGDMVGVIDWVLVGAADGVEDGTVGPQTWAAKSIQVESPELYIALHENTVLVLFTP
jgi:hypothetical protein